MTNTIDNPYNRPHKIEFIVATDYENDEMQTSTTFVVDYNPITGRYFLVNGKELLEELIAQSLHDLAQKKDGCRILLANVDFFRSSRLI